MGRTQGLACANSRVRGAKAATACVLSAQLSILKHARTARHRDDVADVLDPRRELNQALKPHAPTCVWHAAIPAQVKVPVQLAVGVDPSLPSRVLQQLEVVLAFAPADQLANPRHEKVKAGNRVRTGGNALHVERLASPRVVGHEDWRPAAELLREVALMLALERQAPLDGVRKLLPAPGERVNRFVVGHSHPLRLHRLGGVREALGHTVSGRRCFSGCVVREEVADVRRSSLED
mmetsp:Transcript_1447/g.3575  ORF Transcript_1447/g.3575 Transcript_1447/m.3575 type:complete len:235 (+) Transcript_1447:339-1043(+)